MLHKSALQIEAFKCEEVSVSLAIILFIPIIIGSKQSTEWESLYQVEQKSQR